MRLNFEEKELYFVREVFSRALMTTEAVFDLDYNELIDPLYIYHLIELRAKIFAAMGEQDPNQEVISMLVAKLNNSQKN